MAQKVSCNFTPSADTWNWPLPAAPTIPRSLSESGSRKITAWNKRLGCSACMALMVCLQFESSSTLRPSDMKSNTGVLVGKHFLPSVRSFRASASAGSKQVPRPSHVKVISAAVSGWAHFRMVRDPLENWMRDTRTEGMPWSVFMQVWCAAWRSPQDLFIEADSS